MKTAAPLILAVLADWPISIGGTVHASKARPSLIDAGQGMTETLQDSTLLDLTSHQKPSFPERFDLGGELFYQQSCPDEGNAYGVVIDRSMRNTYGSRNAGQWPQLAEGSLEPDREKLAVSRTVRAHGMARRGAS